MEWWRIHYISRFSYRKISRYEQCCRCTTVCGCKHCSFSRKSCNQCECGTLCIPNIRRSLWIEYSKRLQRKPSTSRRSLGHRRLRILFRPIIRHHQTLSLSHLTNCKPNSFKHSYSICKRYRQCWYLSSYFLRRQYTNRYLRYFCSILCIMEHNFSIKWFTYSNSSSKRHFRKPNNFTTGYNFHK